MNTNFFS